MLLVATRTPRMPEVDLAVTTIALVGEARTRWGTAAVAACLADLAVTDELVVVYSWDERGSGAGVHTMVRELRCRLPRYSIAALYLAPYRETLGRDVAIVREFVEIGSLPVVITPAGNAARVAAELHYCIPADRAVRVSYTLTGGADVQPVLRSPVAVGA